MRQLLKEKLKRHRYPLLGFAMGPMSRHDRNDHSAEHLKYGLKFSPDIIELDIRKSSDGVIYCYHGSIPWGYIYSQFFFRSRSFSEIRKYKPWVKTLDEMLGLIPDPIMITLDLKESNISVQDLGRIINTHSERQFWVHTLTLRKLKRIHKGLGEDVLYSTGLPFFFANSSYKKAIGLVDVVSLYYWQAKDKELLNKLREAGLEYVVARWLAKLENREQLSEQNNSIWIYYRDISKAS